MPHDPTLLAEAALCLWEAMLEADPRGADPALQEDEIADDVEPWRRRMADAWNSYGTVEMRHGAIRLAPAAADIFDGIGGHEAAEYLDLLPYDWEFIPALLPFVEWEYPFVIDRVATEKALLARKPKAAEPAVPDLLTALRELVQHSFPPVGNGDADGYLRAKHEAAVRQALAAIAAADKPAPAQAKPEPAPPALPGIEWHRLVDGDPPERGPYLVAHRSLARVISYLGAGHAYRSRGWAEDVSAFSHWAVLPLPKDGAPQLFTRRGQEQRAATVEHQAWVAMGGGDA